MKGNYMLKSKERAYLRGLANTMEPIFNIGKTGVSADMTTSVGEALKKRELIKVSVLKNCPYDIKDMAEKLSERTRSEVVQIIGKKITLYKRNNDDPTIILPR